MVSSDEEWSDDCPSDEFNDSDTAKKRKRSKKKTAGVMAEKGLKSKVGKGRPSKRSTESDWWHGLVDADTNANDPAASGKIVHCLFG